MKGSASCPGGGVVRRVAGVAVLLCWAMRAAAADPVADTVQRILQSIDAMNRYSDSYTASVEITSYAPRRVAQSSRLAMYTRGLDRVLVVYRDPPKDAGKRILVAGNRIWFLSPRAQTPIVMNQVATVFGSVTVGDVMGPPILRLYEYKGYRVATKDGREGVELEFSARDRSAQYGRMLYFCVGDTVVSSESYSRSGILLKRALFEDFTVGAQGAPYATRIRVENAATPGYAAVIQISDLRSVTEIPDYYFTPDGMAKVHD